jgi:hypothetical protein
VVKTVKYKSNKDDLKIKWLVPKIC